MCIRGPMASRVGGPDILDGTGLGRWCGTTIAGQDGRKLSIITAYRVCSGSPQTSPIGSSFLREYEFFCERQYTSLNPRQIFLANLQTIILGLQEAGHSTILMLDANSRERRFREASIPEAFLKLCPFCRTEDETPQHFARCQSKKSFHSSMAILQSNILTSNIHLVRYLLCDGICHALQSDTPYSPTTSQYPSHFNDMIIQALESQRTLGWFLALKGYFTKDWGIMAQIDMHRGTRVQQKGETRMLIIIRALSAHIRRHWLARNESLYSPNDKNLDSIWSAETAEIKFYYDRPHLLRTGDQHYCRRSLSKLLAGSPATRRRWLRKVKQSTAELTNDGTRQTLLDKFLQYTS